MTPFKIVLTGALASLCLTTAVQAADYQEEPYAEVETRYHTKLLRFRKCVHFLLTSVKSRHISGPVMLRNESMAALCQTGVTGAVRLPLGRGRDRARTAAGSSSGV